jgi:peptidoglycan/LPS O-acetylase OafA/YrhL
MDYRPEIDGLRAISVIGVILYHAGFEFFKGGFLGVDIFFVISGYLITSIILIKKDKEDFNIIDFYKRRIKRILPVLLSIVIFSFPIAYISFLPHQIEQFHKSIIALLLFSSNFFFWKNTNYFENFTDNEILLHTWSLSVEEQFYIIFPIVILLFFNKQKLLILFLISILIASLLLSEIAWRNFPVANFYLLPTRIWEILSGSIVAFVLLKKKVHSNNFFSLIGLIIIMYSFFCIDKDIPIPSFYALFPIFGTLLIIIYSQNNSLINKILSNKFLVTIGLMSYSLYLWHVPIFSFANLNLLFPPPFFLKLLLCLIIFPISYISWKYIEQPFRKDTNIYLLNDKSKFKIIFLGYLIIFLICMINLYNNKFNIFLSPFALSQHEPHSKNAEYINTNYSNNYSKNWGENKLPKVFLIGDSFSQDIYNILYESNYLNKINILPIYEPVKCGVLFLEKNVLDKINKPSSKHICSSRNSLIDNDIFLKNIKSAEIIMISSDWQNHHIDNLEKSLLNLKKLTNAKIIIFGPKKLIRLNKKHYNLPLNSRKSLKLILNNNNNQIVEQISDKLDLNFINIQKAICGGYDDFELNCDIFDDSGYPKSFDGGHLSIYGARYLGIYLNQYLDCIIFNICKTED